MGASAGWFGGGGRHLFGWLHLPESGSARGAVALCPPFGLEYLATHRTFRTLAGRLCDEGLAVLRFDWYGTGDSSGSLDDATVDGWVDDVGVALARLRAIGVERTAVVGLRLGATLAATAVDRDQHTDAMVLLDPGRSGRTFLREQRALYAVSEAVHAESKNTESTRTETLGFAYPEALAQELQQLDLAAVRVPGGTPTLLLARADRPIDKHLSEWSSADGVERDETDDLAELLDVPPSEARVPQHAIERITKWLSALWDDRSAPVTDELDSSMTTRAPAGETVVVEQVTTLGAVGLFGIVTQPEAVREGTATVVFLPVAAEHRVGPGRMWAELTRELSGLGYRCLRFDLSGLGDSPTRPGQAENWVYAPEALDDIDAVLEAMSPDAAGGLVLVGLCSGAHAAMKAVARAGRRKDGGPPTAVQSVCALNPFLWYGGKAYVASEPYQAGPIAAPVRSWMRVHLKDRLHRLGDSLPEVLWNAIDSTPLAQRPTAAPEAVVDAGVDLLLVLEQADAATLERRFPSALRTLEDTGRFTLAAPEGGDHSLFGTRPREEVRRIVRQHIESVVPAPPSDR